MACFFLSPSYSLFHEKGVILLELIGLGSFEVDSQGRKAEDRARDMDEMGDKAIRVGGSTGLVFDNHSPSDPKVAI
jgi:hypothetical protein